MTDEQIAMVCHEVNRAYCQALGDDSQRPWAEAPAWQKESAILGVQFHRSTPDSKPSDSHESWLKKKRADGWTYGPTKDAESKTHPCLVQFEALPRDQQAKDFIFTAIVRALESIAQHPKTKQWSAVGKAP